MTAGFAPGICFALLPVQNPDFLVVQRSVSLSQVRAVEGRKAFAMEKMKSQNVKLRLRFGMLKKRKEKKTVHFIHYDSQGKLLAATCEGNSV